MRPMFAMSSTCSMAHLCSMCSTGSMCCMCPMCFFIVFYVCLPVFCALWVVFVICALCVICAQRLIRFRALYVSPMCYVCGMDHMGYVCVYVPLGPTYPMRSMLYVSCGLYLLFVSCVLDDFCES